MEQVADQHVAPAPVAAVQMQWSEQQQDAIDAVVNWLGTPGRQVFRLFGFAGSGKTTLAKEIAKRVDGEVMYAAFTGKAALVLRKKGCDGASTLHSLIYKPSQDPDTGKMTFRLNHDSELGFAELLIVDEVSMVDNKLGDDVLRFGTKVLVLGDPAQLPPVGGAGFFINDEPDVMLSEVHRQAEGSPIIKMSMLVRKGLGLEFGTYGDSAVMERAKIDRGLLRELVLGADQILCGTNATRASLNTQMRNVQGKVGEKAPWHPVPGDRLVCLKNNRDHGLLNGSLWDVVKSEHVDYKGGPGYFNVRIKSVDEPQRGPQDVCIRGESFLGTEKTLNWREFIGFQEFTYGYALTVHKSQGSQWDNVVVYDESHVFREDARKHLYTAITRAAKKVTVLR